MDLRAWVFDEICCPLSADTVPPGLAGSAQAVYGTVGIGGATALLTVVSDWLFARFGPAGFWGMALLSCLALPVIWSLQRSLSGAKAPSQHPQ